MRFYLVIIASVVFLAKGSVWAQDFETSQPKKHQLIAGFFQNIRLNETPSTLVFIPKPFLLYLRNEEEWSLFSLTAGVFNRLALTMNVDERLSWLVGGETLFIFAGDKPKIDGEDLNQFNFNANRYHFFTGPKWNIGEGREQLQVWLRYESEYFQSLDRVRSTEFTSPSSFWEHGATVAIEGPPDPPSELFEFGVRPILVGSLRKRMGLNRWGPSGSETQQDWYAAGTAGFSIALSMKKNWVIFVTKSQVSLISHGDRLNALREGSYRMPPMGLVMQEVKADRAWTAEMGPRIYPWGDKRWGVRPFAFSMYFREVQPEQKDVRFAAGGGLKMFGALGSSAFWQVGYAAIGGHREDKDIIHEMRLDFSYSFF
jgi:hypothetical protein